ncbi:MAG TPA: PQQ-dependent sugar dehydrogenase [Gemmatimonadaceae bacterium]|nr:PQQ-dependent sugar dehydrogenase [Gemmatimonadaceae bacterium]
MIRSLVLVAALLGVSIVSAQSSRVTCDASNGGITLPEGFCALVVADSLGPARHIALAPNGDLFVALRNTRDAKGAVLALRDTNRDGRMDVRERFGDNGGTGIALRGTDLFFATDDAVLRYSIPRAGLRPAGPPDTVVGQLATGRSHSPKTIALRGNDLFVNIGAPSNSCQAEDRRPQSPGQDPCPELETRAGIWRFDGNRTRQTQASGERWATGIRNAVAITVDGNTLWAAQHGRDQLMQNWPAHFDTTESAELPAEELFRVERGDDFGWPYCFYDGIAKRKVLAPEYGGDGQQVGRCASVKGPVAAMPAHWAPNAILVYRGTQFPARYRGGAFIAFHGSWNRAPRPQGGYNVVFLPFENGRAGQHELFATGFAGDSVQPAGARHRPTGLAVGPDGSLYISDDRGGRIWRVMSRR